MNENIGEIILYHGEDGSALIEVQLVNETVWLSQRQMVEFLKK